MGNAYGIQRGRSRNISAARRKHEAGMEGGDEEGEGGSKCTPAKCKSCCKSFTAFLFSTIGLVIMVVAYSAGGGFLFQMIEEGKERRDIEASRIIVSEVTAQRIDNLWNVTRTFNILYKENWTIATEKVMKEFQMDIYNAVTELSWDGKDPNEDIETAWNFPGALLYAVTAITTIGYGHVTPKTSWGMMSTILYCLFGLPLTLMCIANLGKFFARVFRILYHTCCCGICCICCLSCRKRQMAMKMAKEEAIQSGGVADLEAVGNGKSIVITNDPSSNGKKSKIGGKPSLAISKAQVWMMNVKKKFNHSLRDDVTVPVYLCLVVMAAYIMGGALIFSIWENWSYLTGAYFCFVTLTTIGFGDYVPGLASATSEGGTERLVLCSVYVFVGLALVGMCIDLMQADVIQKFKWIAKKIGIMGGGDKKAPTEFRDSKRPKRQLSFQERPAGLKVDIAGTTCTDIEPDREEGKFVSSYTVSRSNSKVEFKDESKEAKKKHKESLRRKGSKNQKSEPAADSDTSPSHAPLLDDSEAEFESITRSDIKRSSSKKSKKANKSDTTKSQKLKQSMKLEVDCTAEKVDTEPNNKRKAGVGSSMDNTNNNALEVEPSKSKKPKEKKDKGDNKKSKKKKSKSSAAGDSDNEVMKALVHPAEVELIPPDDIVICEPPPAYAELPSDEGKPNKVTGSSPSASSCFTTPPTPASHYDDLPTHISSLTPDFNRMRDVETPRHIPPDGASLNGYADYNNKSDYSLSNGAVGTTPQYHPHKSDDSLDNVLEDPLFTDSKGNRCSMQLDDNDNDELLLTVSRSSNV